MSPHPAIPPYLKNTSRSHSTQSNLSISSVRSTSSSRSASRPRAQNEYRPSTNGGYAIIGTSEPPFEADLDPRDWTEDLSDNDDSAHGGGTKHHHHHHNNEDGDDHDHAEEEGDETDSEADWDAIRERDASNPSWRRARPIWIYPYLFCATLTIGMSMAPKSELYINLACLVHPPSAPSSITTTSTVTDLYVRPRSVAYDRMIQIKEETLSLDSAVSQEGDDIWRVVGEYDTYASSDNSTMPIDPTIGGVIGQTPGDRWFLKLQKDIYEYRRQHTPSTPHSPSPSPSTTHPKLPPGPVPQPTMPGTTPSYPEDGSEDGREGDKDGDGEDNGDGARSRGPPFHAIDPKLCKKDPRVQAAAAKLTMTMTVTLGILSALTTGFWGKTSDRSGRTKVFTVLETAMLLSETSFVLVASFPYLAPGGYRALLIGPTFDGLAGGISCLIATAHAYISDLTPDGSRAGAFSKLSGIIMSGFACGPILGSLVIAATDNIMTPFYINICVHAIWPLVLLFIIPESLSPEARAHLSKKVTKAADRKKAKEALQREWEDTEHDPMHSLTDQDESSFSRVSGPAGHSRRRKRFMGRVKRGTRRLLGFLEPLMMFKPAKKEGGGRDWSMPLIAFGIFCETLNFGVLGVKAQYMLFSYGWTSAQLGPYMSAAGFSRGFTLIVLLPLVMRYLRSRYATSAPNTTSTPAIVIDDTTQQSSETSPLLPEEPTAPAVPVPHAQTKLDLITARSSFIIESVCLIVLGLNVSEQNFIIVSLLLTLGSGSNPALNSLALGLLPSKSESGRLFGALAVLHALGTTLISPIVFGELFAATVGIYAPMVFLVAGFMPALAFLGSLFVKIKARAGDEERGRVKKGKKRLTGE